MSSLSRPFFPTVAAISLLWATAQAEPDPLAATYEAHGGLATWQAQGTILYDLEFTWGENVTRDHQVFDLINRQGVVSNPDYAVGYDGSKVWLDLSGKTGPAFPPRFYLWTPFYFAGVPFVFADDGVIKEEVARETFQGTQYRVVRVTFESGVGDAPDDIYHVYIHPETHRVHLLRYTVSYFATAQGQPTDGLPESAMLYENWTPDASGLELANDATPYAWKGGSISGAPKGRMLFRNLRLLPSRPDPAHFAAPASAKAVE
jgi:hypothetical protein